MLSTRPTRTPPDLHHVAARESVGVTEVGVVARAAEAWELLQVEGGGADQQQHHQGEGAEPHDRPVGVAGHQSHLVAVLWKLMLSSWLWICW
jgi:hypothetical protein